MKLKRRTFLKMAGAAGAAALAGRPARADAASPVTQADAKAVLVDTTRCVGCRGCEAACSEANGLSGPVMLGDDAVFDTKRATDSRTYTVVNRHKQVQAQNAPRYVKSQCMHCLEPACASACLVAALEKTPEGPVVYHPDRCLGCRYCMVACPFDVPKFEYEKALPYVQKCSFCVERQARGEVPACVDVCPSGALQFGSRKELLEIAKTRIYQNPDKYVHHVYGEHEAGGTSWLYITDVPFEQLGFHTDVGTRPYPEFTWVFLSAVPFVLTLWPPFLMGLYAFARAREKSQEAERSGHPTASTDESEKEPRHE